MANRVVVEIVAQGNKFFPALVKANAELNKFSDAGNKAKAALQAESAAAAITGRTVEQYRAAITKATQETQALAAASQRQAQTARSIQAFNELAARGAQRLATALQAERAALERNRATLQRYREEKNRVSAATGFLAAGLRGFALQATAAYTAFNLLSNAIQALSEFQLAEARLKQLSSGLGAFALNMQFTSEAALELSADLGQTRDSFARLLVLQRQGLLTTKQTQQIFEGLQNTAAALGATSAQVGQALYGLTQALSQSRVQAQELNQITEALPGLLGELDNAAGLAAGGFRRLTIEGGVTDSVLRDTLIPAFAAFEGAAKNRSEAIIGQFTRLKNEAKLLIEALEPLAAVITLPLSLLNGLISGVRGAFASLSDGGGVVGAFQLQEARFFIEDINRLGFGDLSASLQQVLQSSKDGLTSAQQAFETARDAAERLNQLLLSRSKLERDLRQANLEIQLAADRKELESRIETYGREVRERESTLREIEQAEKRAADKIASLRQQLADSQQSAEQRLIDIRRSAQPEFLQQFQNEQELAQRLLEVQKRLAEAREADTEAERDAAIQAAQAAQERANTLTERIDGQFKLQRAIEQAAKSEQSILQTQITLAEQEKAKQEDAKQAEIQRLDDVRPKLEALTQLLETLTSGEKDIKLETNAQQAEKELAKIQAQIDRLAEGVTIPIRTSGGVNVEQRRWGGYIPGYGGGDRVPALLEAGEFVIRKEAVRRHGLGFLDRLNSLQLPAIRVPTLPVMPSVSQTVVQRFQTGGEVRRGEEVTLNLNLNGGKRAQLRGGRDDIRTLVDTLSQVARASA